MKKSITLTQKLVSIPSVSGNEQKIFSFLKKYLTKHGLTPIFLEKALLVHISGKNNEQAIIFNGHVDTVPSGNTSQWKFPPHGSKSGQIINGKICGLGSSDMKSAVAAMTSAILKWKNKIPPCDLWLCLVAEEETTGAGSKEFVSWFESKGHLDHYLEVSCILGEPTNLESIVLGNRGSIFMNLTFHGNPGHGSTPEKIKKHAIFEAIKAIQNIEKKKDEYLNKFKHPKMGIPSIGITAISAGNAKAQNKFPESCVVSIDFRIVPGMDGLSPEKIIKEIIGDVDFSYDGPLVIKPLSAPYTKPGKKVVKKLIKASGISRTSTKRSSTDMATFIRKGIPSCIFGPGNPDLIHKPNEYCEVENIIKAEEIYFKLIKLFGNDKS